MKLTQRVSNWHNFLHLKEMENISSSKTAEEAINFSTVNNNIESNSNHWDLEMKQVKEAMH